MSWEYESLLYLPRVFVVIINIYDVHFKLSNCCGFIETRIIIKKKEARVMEIRRPDTDLTRLSRSKIIGPLSLEEWVEIYSRKNMSSSRRLKFFLKPFVTILIVLKWYVYGFIRYFLFRHLTRFRKTHK